jgi:hypothetical protein
LILYRFKVLFLGGGSDGVAYRLSFAEAGLRPWPQP